jgi:glucose/mannose-6-phosphate isomerase
MESLTSPITHFKEQFTFTPEIRNTEALVKCTNVVVCGMGGSAISVNLLKLFFPELPLTLHNSYGLPVQYDKENTLFIINSYSGNTEESLDAYERTKKENLYSACISLGGELIRHAEIDKKAHIKLPESSLEPRFSIGHQMIGILTFMGETKKITTLKEKVEHIDFAKTEAQGEALATLYKDKYPVLYASANLYPVAYLIKAAINEGAKVPSFVNIIPEANHNELQSFVTDDTHTSANHFAFLFCTSTYDHVRVLKRFSIMNELYKGRGFTLSTLETDHTDIFQVLECIIIGYYMATYMAINKNIDPYKTPFIATFKKKLTE